MLIDILFYISIATGVACIVLMLRKAFLLQMLNAIISAIAAWVMLAHLDTTAGWATSIKTYETMAACIIASVVIVSLVSRKGSASSEAQTEELV